MAEFSKLVITAKGQALIAKMIAGVGNIEFTKVSASSTTYTLSQLEALTALSNVKQTSLISKKTITNNVAIKLEAAFTNTDLTAGYNMKALGLYAKTRMRAKSCTPSLSKPLVTAICRLTTGSPFPAHTSSLLPP